jgi:hypothetical protein
MDDRFDQAEGERTREEIEGRRGVMAAGGEGADFEI